MEVLALFDAGSARFRGRHGAIQTPSEYFLQHESRCRNVFLYSFLDLDDG